MKSTEIPPSGYLP